jgi:predicted ABC-type transport system involved in lysophospholipase L1 biosynthesis ATPase subunit
MAQLQRVFARPELRRVGQLEQISHSPEISLGGQQRLGILEFVDYRKI